MPSLSQILDVDLPPFPPSSNANTVVVVHDVSASQNNDVSQDASDARNNVRLMIAQGTQAINELLALARELKTPRAYEVAANMLKTMAELNHDLLHVHEQEMSMIEPPPDTPALTGNVTIEQAVFVGSTTDLQELIRQKREEKKRAAEIKVIDASPQS